MSKHSAATRVIARICAQPWLITPDALQTILDIAARDNFDIGAVEAELGRPLDNTHTVTVRDGVAAIPVTGPLFRYADMFTQISGATSIEMLALDLERSLNDPKVKAIILQVDSPGGEVNGVSEFADMVYAARDRKPIAAYVMDEACSAAYWIASAAGEVVIADTALIGSIGVVMAVPTSNPSRRQIEFVSSQSPRKRADPSSSDGAEHFQGIVDDLADVFVDAVARNRDVPRDAVLADFGQGGILVGQKAVEAGLADRVGSYESLLAELATADRLPADHAPAAPISLPAASAQDPVLTPSSASPPILPITPVRRARMKLRDLFTKMAAEQGVEIEDLDALDGQPPADLSALEQQLAAQKAENERLRVAQERHQIELDRMAAERRHAEAQRFCEKLVEGHRLSPAAAEALVPLAVRILALDAVTTTAEGEPRTGELLTSFAEALPTDVGLFTRPQVPSTDAAALFPQLTTPGLDPKAAEPTLDEVADIIAMYPAGREVAAQLKASIKTAGNGAGK